jgi:3-dehydroquinate synthase
METLEVTLGERSYPILMGRGISQRIADELEAEHARGRRVAVVTDANVATVLPEEIRRVLERLPVFTVAPGEQSKSLTVFGELCEFLANQRVDRGGVLVAVGGGVVGDLAGFAAAAFLRGIEFRQVPTTLLAMVDSAVGGKTGVNLVAGKNLVGAFHQPRVVYCDTALLDTLPSREFAAGMAEVIKYGLLADAPLFERLEVDTVRDSRHENLSRIVGRCCEIKVEIVRADERETASEGGRALLNLGHTFAHAIEAVAGYGEYLHGEAVAVGLVAAADLSERLGLVEEAVPRRVRAVVEAHGLPLRLRAALPAQRLLDAMQRDKKVRDGRLKFVVLERIGSAATRAGVASATVGEIWSELGAS